MLGGVNKHLIAFAIGFLSCLSANLFAATADSGANPSDASAAVSDNTEISNPFSSVDSEFSFKIEDVELIFQTQVNRLVLGDTFGIQKNGAIYIGIQTLFDILDFPIDVDISKKTADGWFIKEDNLFSMDYEGSTTTPLTISSKKVSHSIKQRHVLFREDDIYIETNVIFNILEITHEINTNALTLKIIPTELLPIQRKIARQKRKKFKRPNHGASLPQKYIPYKLWTIPFLDVQTRYISNNTNIDTYNYSVLGSSDLAYMTSTFYVQGDKTDNLKNFRIKLYRDSINNDLLGPLKATHFSLGEISPVTIGNVAPTGQEIGVKISNRPFGRNLRIQQTDFVGDSQPGWDVELYRNNIYLGGQTVGDNGRYEFYNQDILPGDNKFKLVFYGPQGQQVERIENINLSKAGRNFGKFLYDISLTKQHSRLFNLQDNVSNNEEDNRRFNINLFQDINEYVSLQTSFSRYTFLDGTKHSFVKPAVRLFVLETLLFGNITKDVYGGHSTYYSLARTFWNQSFTFSSTSRSTNYLTEASVLEKPAQRTTSYSLSGPLLKSKYLKIQYGLGIKNLVTDNIGKTDSYSTDISAKSLGFNLTNNLSLIESRPINTNLIRTVTGSASISKSIFQYNLRGRVNYLLEPIKRTRIKKVNNFSGNISRLFFSRMRAQYTLNYTPPTRTTTHALSLNWRADSFTLTSNYTRNSGGNYSVYGGINFSLGFDKNNKKFRFGSERISQTGGISATVFVDENDNGILDSNETTVKDARVQAEQAKRHGKSDGKGAIFFPGLPVDRRTDVELDIASVKDPFLVSSTPGYSFVPRPGVVESINVPLVNAGEVEGTIYLENANGSKQYAGYVSLELTNIKSRLTRSVISAYDGFYLFSNIPPGKYLVSVDKSYLAQNRYGIRTPSTHVVLIGSNGNVEMGNDFTVYPLKQKNTQ